MRPTRAPESEAGRACPIKSTTPCSLSKSRGRVIRGARRYSRFRVAVPGCRASVSLIGNTDRLIPVAKLSRATEVRDGFFLRRSRYDVRLLGRLRVSRRPSCPESRVTRAPGRKEPAGFAQDSPAAA